MARGGVALPEIDRGVVGRLFMTSGEIAGIVPNDSPSARVVSGLRCWACEMGGRGSPSSKRVTALGLERAQRGVERAKPTAQIWWAASSAVAQRLWLTTSTLWPSGSSTKAP
jgi:hypothetical protein